MRDRIAAQADPQRRRDHRGAVELLERAPFAFGGKIARGALQRDGGDAPIRMGRELRGAKHLRMAARMPGRQDVGKQPRRRCGRRRQHGRHDSEGRQKARRCNGAPSFRQQAWHRYGVHYLSMLVWRMR